MRNVKDYIKITKLNRKKDMQSLEEGLGYHVGNAVAYHNGDEMRFITYLEFSAGQVKGNHYHKEKIENMAIIKGRLHAKYYFADNPEIFYKVDLNEGDIVSVMSGVAHAYLSDEGCSVIEFSPQRYDDLDVYKVDNMKGVF